MFPTVFSPVGFFPSTKGGRSLGGRSQRSFGTFGGRLKGGGCLFCWGRKGVEFWGGSFGWGKFLVGFWLMGLLLGCLILNAGKVHHFHVKSSIFWWGRKRDETMIHSGHVRTHVDWKTTWFT